MSKIILPLMAETGLSEVDLRKVIHNAPRRYKHFTIEKRNGGRRPISQPAFELKVIQRAFAQIILQKLPVHECATAYRFGISIKENALRHSSNGPILKFDFKNFFPSIRGEDWIRYCRRRKLFDDEEDMFIGRNIMFYRSAGSSLYNLAIGAPTSPQLSNILMYDFDNAMSEIAAKEKVVYTRYADDLTFSAKRTGYLQHVEAHLKRILRELESPRLTINEDKTVFSTKKYKRVVTGLIITNDGAVSIGHDRKKVVRAAVYQALLGKLDLEQTKNLAGYLSFISDVEPTFLQALIAKYGYSEIRRIQVVNQPPAEEG